MCGDTKTWAPSHLQDASDDLKNCIDWINEDDPVTKKFVLDCIEVTIQSLKHIKKH